MQNKSLFARYKDFINTRWENGFRTYTSRELNAYVGSFEISTRWKFVNNNPYYTTRRYQALLKRLGCISMQKRGLWEINAPIPHWFCSLHLNALLNSTSLKRLESSSHVWQSLPPAHKVNPWRDIQEARILAENQRRRDVLNAQLDSVKAANTSINDRGFVATVRKTVLVMQTVEVLLGTLPGNRKLSLCVQYNISFDKKLTIDVLDTWLSSNDSDSLSKYWVEKYTHYLEVLHDTDFLSLEKAAIERANVVLAQSQIYKMLEEIYYA